MKKYHIFLISILILFQGIACKTISPYDQYAYIQGTSLKVDALKIMDKATSPYSENLEAINNLNTQLEKAYEYEKHRPTNEISMKMWTVIKNPDGNLLGGFLKRWKDQNSLNEVFIQEAKIQVSEAFDMVTELESKKIKTSDNRLMKFLTTP